MEQGDCEAAEKDAITEFNDTNLLTTSECTMFEKLYDSVSNPFPTDIPTKLLGRNYLLGSPTFSSTEVATYSFPSALLLASPQLVNCLSNYKYFRSGVKIQIKVASTPYHQGSLIVSWMPLNGYASSNVYEASGNKPIVLDVAMQESVTMDIPYFRHRMWRDNTIGTATTNDWATVEIRVLNPIIATSPGIGTSVPVKVFGNFTRPRVAGWLTQSGDVTDSAKLEDKEASGKTETAVDKMAGAAKDIGYFLRTAPVVGKIANPVLDLASGIGTVLSNLSMPQSKEPISPMEPTNVKFNSLGSGISDTDFLTLFPNHKITMDLNDCFTSNHKLNALAQIPMLYRQLSFSTASTVFYEPVHPSAWSTSANRNNPDYLAFAASTCRYYRGGMKFMLHFLATQFYSCRVRIGIMYNEGTPPGDLDATGDAPSRVIDIKGSTTVQLYVPFLMQKFWEFTNEEFVGNQMPRIYIIALTNVIGSSSPSTASMYLNIWRSAAEDFQLIYPNAAMRLDGDDGKYFFESPSQEERMVLFRNLTLTGNSHVHIRKRRHKKMGFEQQLDVVKYFSQPFCSCIDNTKYTLERGLVSGEGNYSIKDLCMRPSHHNYYNTNVLNLPVTYPDVGPNDSIDLRYFQRQLFRYFSNIFIGWRGSRRAQYMDPSKGGNNIPAYGFMYPPIQGSDIASELTLFAEMSTGMVLVNQPDYLIHKVTIPYYCTQPYRQIAEVADTAEDDLFFDEFPEDIHYCNAVQATTDSTTFQISNPPYLTNVDYGIMTLAAGDDFMYIYLRPPTLSIRPAPSRAQPTSTRKDEKKVGA
jgi:hypothetical protein